MSPSTTCRAVLACLVASLLGGARPSGPSLEQKLRYLEAENTMLQRAVESKNRQLAKLTSEVARLKALLKEAAGEARGAPDPPAEAKVAKPAPAAEPKPAPKDAPATVSTPAPPGPATPAVTGRAVKLTGAFASDEWTKGRSERLEAVFTPTSDAQAWTAVFTAAFRNGTHRFTGTLRGNPRQGTVAGTVRAGSGRTFTFEGRAEAGRISARAREGNKLQAVLMLK